MASTPAWLIRPGSTITGSAARTTSRPTGSPARRPSPLTPPSGPRPGPTGPSWAAAAGIRQFLDLGTGLPTASNTHEVAQAIAPESRIVYVDNDPLVLSHARALLTSTPQGRTSYLDADLRDPDAILRAAAVTDTLD